MMNERVVHRGFSSGSFFVPTQISCTSPSRLVEMKRRAICAIATPSVPSVPNAPTIEGGRRGGGLLDSVGGAALFVGRSVSETARAAQFWSAVLAIWGRYKVTQVRSGAALARGNEGAAKRLWKYRHAHEAKAIWRLCVDMRVSIHKSCIHSSFLTIYVYLHIYLL